MVLRVRILSHVMFCAWINSCDCFCLVLVESSINNDLFIFARLKQTILYLKNIYN